MKCAQEIGHSSAKPILPNNQSSVQQTSQNREDAFNDDFIFEAFVAEAIIQNLMAGMYVDITDVKRNFKHEHFATVVCEYAKKYNII